MKGRKGLGKKNNFILVGVSSGCLQQRRRGGKRNHVEGGCEVQSDGKVTVYDRTRSWLVNAKTLFLI